MRISLGSVGACPPGYVDDGKPVAPAAPANTIQGCLDAAGYNVTKAEWQNPTAVAALFARCSAGMSGVSLGACVPDNPRTFGPITAIPNTNWQPGYVTAYEFENWKANKNSYEIAQRANAEAAARNAQQQAAYEAEQRRVMTLPPSYSGSAGQIVTAKDGVTRYQWQNGAWSKNVCDAAGYKWVDDGVNGLNGLDGCVPVDKKPGDTGGESSNMTFYLIAAGVAAFVLTRSR